MIKAVLFDYGNVLSYPGEPGRIVETGPVDLVLDHPRHPYTIGLLGSAPSATAPGAPLTQINGAAPRIDARPSGCAFRTRCNRATELCAEQDPQPTIDGERIFRCHHPASIEIPA